MLAQPTGPLVPTRRPAPASRRATPIVGLKSLMITTSQPIPQTRALDVSPRPWVKSARMAALVRHLPAARSSHWLPSAVA